jgi:hypothetical protein
VYAGRYPNIARTISDLESLCSSQDIDIITLAGVTTYFAEGAPRPLPIADFDTPCNDTLSILPTGTEDCAALAKTLRTCQTTHDKKLFLAVEAGTETTTLRSAREATTLASVLWDTFGAGRSTASGAREYGGPPTTALGIAFDGFEFLVNTTTIDDGYFAAVAKAKRGDDSVFIPPTLPYFDVLFGALRELFLHGNSGKPYYLSVSLPCTRPSIIARPALEHADFVSVRFMDDVACNINGLAFTNFLSAWGKDIADESLSDRVSHQGHDEDEHASASVQRTSPRGPTSASRLIDPNRFSIPRYTSLAVSHTAIHDSWTTTLPEANDNERQLKRQDALPPSSSNNRLAPHFLLGIPIPSFQTQNATLESGVGSADPTTLANIIRYAKGRVAGFAGVLLWGGVAEMEVGHEGGYLGFVSGVLDGTGKIGMVAGPPPSPWSLSVPEVVSTKSVASGVSLRAVASASRSAEASAQASLVGSPASSSSIVEIATSKVMESIVVWLAVASASLSVSVSVTGSTQASVVVENILSTPLVPTHSLATSSSQGGGTITVKSTRILTTTIVRSASTAAAVSSAT